MHVLQTGLLSFCGDSNFFFILLKNLIYYEDYVALFMLFGASDVANYSWHTRHRYYMTHCRYITYDKLKIDTARVWRHQR